MAAGAHGGHRGDLRRGSAGARAGQRQGGGLAPDAGGDGAALDAVANATDLSGLSVYLSVTGGRA